MNVQPEKIVSIALDDYIKGLKGIISNELYGKIEDELKHVIPNTLKDEKLHVTYDKNNYQQHVYLHDPKRPIGITTIQRQDY